MSQLPTITGGFQSAINRRPGPTLKSSSSVAVLLLLLAAGLCPAKLRGEEGIALAIIYDTSGSMKDPVPDASGGSAPKYVIANRALLAVTRQLQAFATNGGATSPRKLQVGLFTFQGEHAREVIPLAGFQASAFEDWANRFSHPHGNTPLGNSLSAAARAVLDSPLARKHVLVITDGLNTAGPPPQVVLPRLKQRAKERNASLSVHFIAFDVDARQFEPLKKLGATVVGASDEKQLNSQLQYILQQKILLEDEEPPKTH